MITNRVFRGGSWNSGARGLRSALRGGVGPGIRYDFVGFRLVRNSDEKKSVPPAVPYDEGLIEDLRDPKFAVAYLNEILSDTGKGVKERFIHGLSLVAKAHGITN